MKTLVVDDKWSIEYDDKNNDSPRRWLRHGEDAGDVEMNNPTCAMFYALLAKEQEAAPAPGAKT
jgi:hypothetical protein